MQSQDSVSQLQCYTEPRHSDHLIGTTGTKKMAIAGLPRNITATVTYVFVHSACNLRIKTILMYLSVLQTHCE